MGCDVCERFNPFETRVCQNGVRPTVLIGFVGLLVMTHCSIDRLTDFQIVFRGLTP
jgi:hypothetical protein